MVVIELVDCPNNGVFIFPSGVVVIAPPPHLPTLFQVGPQVAQHHPTSQEPDELNPTKKTQKPVFFCVFMPLLYVK